MLSRLRAVLRTSLLAAVLACSAACGGNPASPSGARLTKLAGDGQQGSAGEPLYTPLMVRATDAQGGPLADEPVTFAVVNGGGSVTSTQVTTDPSGVAQTAFVLGPAPGTNTASATMRSATPVVFSATAGPGLASQLAVVSGDAQTGTVGAALAAPIVVRATDRFGNPVPYVHVELTPGPGGGSLTPNLGPTNASGQFSATWVLGEVAGPKTLTASAPGLASVALTATAVPGPAAQLRLVSGNLEWGTVGTPLPNPFVVGVTDVYGNAVAAGATVTFTATNGGGSVSPRTVVTDANGQASTSWTMGPRIGFNSIAAAVPDLPMAQATTYASVLVRALGHRVVDAEMSLATGKIVTVSANPSRLNVIDPESGTAQSIALTYAPLSVSVAPDGSRAAVGHDGYLSNVNLATGVVDATYPVSTIAGDVVLAGNGYAYIFPSNAATWTNVRSVDMSTGAVAIDMAHQVITRTVAKLHPSGSYVYAADRGISPSDFEKYDVRGGAAAFLYDSPYHGDYSFGGDVWAFDDGSRLIAYTGNLFRASEVQAEDLTYAGSLANAPGIRWAVHSTAASRILVVLDGTYFVPADPGYTVDATPRELRVYDPSALQYLGTVPLPRFNVTGPTSTTQFNADGRFVFFNAAGTRAYALIRADPQSGLALDWGLAAYDRADIP